MANEGRVRYAVVGLGYIAQAAVLPAFAHAKENSELAALVSDDPTKRKVLGEQYGVPTKVFSYEEFDNLLYSGLIDAVYIALPNNMHAEFTRRAAEAGKHVLCEKPMAMTESECLEMIDVCEAHDVRLMIAYRLHFEEANLKAVELVRSGKIGEPRIFQSIFTQQVRDDNVRLRRELSGGSVYDLGVYCINAAHYLFRDEPIEVLATSAAGDDARFEEVDEMTTAILRFPGDRLATFTCSFGAADVSSYRIVGAEGDLLVEPAYEYTGELIHQLTVKGKTSREVFAMRDQFAPELVYFSRAVQSGAIPEPSGHEGLADVRVIEAIYRSAQDGVAVTLDPCSRPSGRDAEQEIHKPPVEEPELVHASGPGG